MPQTIHAAGAVLLRRTGVDGVEVAVIHRPHHDDWTLPKGKVDPGEVLPQTAVREVAEETCLRVTLGAPLSTQHYEVAGKPKSVHYWLASAVEGEFAPTDEVDSLLWLSPDEACETLTYARDAGLVREAVAAPATVPLLLVRHAHAGDASAWLAAGRDDRERPLSERGMRAVPAITEFARAYGVRLAVTSPAARCTQTVAGLRDFALWRESPFVYDGEDLTSDGFAEVLARLRADAVPTALCTHGEQVDWLVAHFGCEPFDFAKGGVLVLHRRADDLGVVAATEWWPPAL